MTHDQISDAMDEVAQRFAHRLALDLECVLANYSGPWYNQAMNTLSQSWSMSHTAPMG